VPLVLEPLHGPFQVSAEAVAVVVQSELLTRLSGLCCGVVRKASCRHRWSNR